MTLYEFHSRLFGRKPGRFLLNRALVKAYLAFEAGSRETPKLDLKNMEDSQNFLASFVFALYQTQGGTKDVALLISPQLSFWCHGQMKEIVRYIVQERVQLGATRTDLKPIIEAVSKVFIVDTKLATVPERYVSYKV